jgi:hypothetical protein
MPYNRYCGKHPHAAQCIGTAGATEDVTVLSLEDFAQAIVDAHDGMGDMTHGTFDVASTMLTVRSIHIGTKMLRELGFMGSYYVTTVGGKDYVVLRGYPQLRNILTGTRYLASNPKLLAFGIGPAADKWITKSNTFLMVTTYVALDITRFILSDERLYSTLFANLIFDIGAGLLSMYVGTTLVTGAVAVFGIAAPVGVVVVCAIAAGVALSWLAYEAERIFHIKENLAVNLRTIAEAVDRGLLKADTLIENAHITLRHALDELNRAPSTFEREWIRHFSPNSYRFLYPD